MPDIETWPPFHPIEAAGYLHEGRFRYGKGIVVMLAIGWAESELGKYRRGPIDFATGEIGNFRWRNPKNPAETSSTPREGWVRYLASIDWSWLMFNDYWHPEVDHQRAVDDPVYAAREALRISGGGKTFGAWAAFNAGRHRAHMAAARYAVALYYLLERDASPDVVASIALYTRRPT